VGVRPAAVLVPGALEATLFGEPQPDPAAAILPQAEAALAALARQRRPRPAPPPRHPTTNALASAYESDLRSILAETREAEAGTGRRRQAHEAWRVAQEHRRSVLDGPRRSPAGGTASTGGGGGAS
jgi:hypothetical protein